MIRIFWHRASIFVPWSRISISPKDPAQHSDSMKNFTADLRRMYTWRMGRTTCICFNEMEIQLFTHASHYQHASYYRLRAYSTGCFDTIDIPYISCDSKYLSSWCYSRLLGFQQPLKLAWSRIATYLKDETTSYFVRKPRKLLWQRKSCAVQHGHGQSVTFYRRTRVQMNPFSSRPWKWSLQ